MIWFVISKVLFLLAYIVPDEKVLAEGRINLQYNASVLFREHIFWTDFVRLVYIYEYRKDFSVGGRLHILITSEYKEADPPKVEKKDFG